MLVVQWALAVVLAVVLVVLAAAVADPSVARNRDAPAPTSCWSHRERQPQPAAEHNLHGVGGQVV